MRRIITGLNAEGRSCILEDQDVPAAPIEGIVGIRTGTLWTTTAHPPEIAPVQFGHRNDVRLAPGAVRWIIVEHEPPGSGNGNEVSGAMHYQPAIEVVFMLDGSSRLVLDDGETELHPGDCVIMPGVDHAIRPGPNGSKALCMAIGMQPPVWV